MKAGHKICDAATSETKYVNLIIDKASMVAFSRCLHGLMAQDVLLRGSSSLYVWWISYLAKIIQGFRFELSEMFVKNDEHAWLLRGCSTTLLWHTHTSTHISRCTLWSVFFCLWLQLLTSLFYTQILDVSERISVSWLSHTILGTQFTQTIWVSDWLTWN